MKLIREIIEKKKLSKKNKEKTKQTRKRKQQRKILALVQILIVRVWASKKERKSEWKSQVFLFKPHLESGENFSKFKIIWERKRKRKLLLFSCLDLPLPSSSQLLAEQTVLSLSLSSVIPRFSCLSPTKISTFMTLCCSWLVSGFEDLYHSFFFLTSLSEFP